MDKFSVNNWNYAQFIKTNRKAIISFGMEPDSNTEQFIYYVTVLDDDNNLINQNKFNNLEPALDFINDKYEGIWDFKDPSTANSGGCGSCSAH